MKYITAHTPNEICPPYINISGDDKTVRVIVRQKGSGDMPYGPEAFIDIPRSEFAKMVEEINAAGV